MKKLLLRTMVLLCALVVGSLNGWAEDYVLYSGTITEGDYVIYYSGKAMKNSIASNRLEYSSVTPSDDKFSNPDASIVWHIAASGDYWTIYSAAEEKYAASTGSKNQAKLETSITDNSKWTVTGTSTYEFENKARAAASSDADKKWLRNNGTYGFACYADATGGALSLYKKQSANQVATPTFSPAAGAFTSAQNVTISCTTEGATIHYTLDGSDPTTTSATYNSAIAVSETKTIKAIAVKAGYDNSNIASATFTILSLKTIAQARTQATGAVYTQGIVTSVNGKTAYIQDNTAAIAVYNSAANLTVAAGDEITVSGTLGTYQGLLQIQTPTINSVSTGNTVTPVVKTIKQINEDKAGSNALQGMLVKIEDAKVTAKNGTTTTDATIQQEESSVQYSITAKGIAQATEYAVNDLLTLVGNVGSSSNTVAQIVNPTNVVVTPNVAPVINASNKTINFDATSGEIAYTIDNPTSATLTAAKTTGDWISNVDVDAVNNKVTFTATANTGAQRTATITLSYTGADNRVITVTQKKYGIATLPFTFDGGKSDIESTTSNYGISHTGLGSDYPSSPKLKFDGTGDNVVLRFNEEPGILSFSVKGNSFSGGTFTVQTSADGTAYTDLDSYTTLGDAETKTYNLESSVRYVKWIYTSKSSGNVALGNINLALPGEPSLPVVSGTKVTLTTTANMEGWRTFTPSKADQNYTADADVYYVSASGATTVTLTKIDDGVPANTPVILHKTSGTTITLTETANVITAPGASNLLAVSTANQNLGKVFRLGYKSGAGKGVGFYSYTSANAPAGIIYVNAPSAARDFLNFDFGDEATGVNDVRGKMSDVRGDYYDLQGRKVANPTKGLYIVNGKKVIIK